MFTTISLILIGTILMQALLAFLGAPLPAIAFGGSVGVLVCLGAFLMGVHSYKKTLTLAILMPVTILAFGMATMISIDQPLDLRLWFLLGLLLLGMGSPLCSFLMILLLNVAWDAFGFELLFKKPEEICQHCNFEIPLNITQHDFCPRCGTNRKAGEK